MKSKKTSKSTNPQLRNLIQQLRDKGKDKDSSIWLDLCRRLSKSGRGRVVVNLSRIRRHTEENDEVIVPGKVLGAGSIDYPIRLAAIGFSAKAKTKILKAKGKCLSIPQIVESNPQGSNIKIIG